MTKLRPDHGAAWANLAKEFALSGQLARADAALAQAIRHEDGEAVVHNLIGSVLSLLGEDEEALAWFGKAAAREPQNVMYRVAHANRNNFV